MNDEQLGALVSGSLRAQAADAPGGAHLLQAVTTGVRRKAVTRRRWVVSSSAAIALAAVSLGLGLWSSARPGDGTQQAAAPSLRPSSFHHLQLEVPASWALNPEPCSPHGRDRVIDHPDLLQVPCLTPLTEATRLGQQVLFSTGRTFSTTYLGPAATTRPITIGGVSGTLSSSTNEQTGMTEFALALPSLDVSVLIDVRSPALAETILHSARVTGQ
ncbi:hypothetical protein G3I60_04430 [Streptomyces sp. SID13666]|uniref:hypothetical protein n=1 Tax=unclassified Streptomyces TaxID=2593676 RepID=UPI0013C14FDC|nr:MULTISPECIES: hypothetical protein [unclassified Streptomyces]NEA53427.1 hypothetical protein [Streptomyces sp. SID13666]NEA69248.1 hypothetical protein [Streptomyces sp. SID13588]